jgi:pimeloyl-ACP methyl ester carboxylesterase
MGSIGVWTLRLLGVLVLLLLLGMVYGVVVAWRDIRQHPAPGQMVDVGGYQLHIHCLGAGRPTVILDAGAGGTSMDWSWVQPEVAKTTRVCAYDRAGMAWSEVGPAPRDAVQMTRELRTLLTNARIEGPYILVGASYGGHIARLYAGQYPAETAGMVLVDARPEDWETRFPEIQQSTADQMGKVRVIAWLSRLGVTRLLLPFTGTPDFVNKFPPDVQPDFQAVGFQAQSYDTIVAVSENAPGSDNQVRAARPPAAPVVVLRHGVSDADLFGALPQTRWPEAEATWQALQADLAQRLNGTLIVADKSGHAIALDQPEAVISAIQRVAAAAPR